MSGGNGSNGWLDMAPQVEELILDRGVTVPGWHAEDETRRRFTDQVAKLLVESRLVTRDDQVIDASQTLSQAITGLGLLQEYLSRPGVEEIIVRNGEVLLEEKGRIVNLGSLASDAYFERVARKAADLGGRGMKADRPFVLVDLPGGARFTAMIPPLSIEGTAINVRVFRSDNDTGEPGQFRDVRPSARARAGRSDPRRLCTWASGYSALPGLDRLSQCGNDPH
jgi:hypothetical protein